MIVFASSITDQRTYCNITSEEITKSIETLATVCSAYREVHCTYCPLSVACESISKGQSVKFAASRLKQTYSRGGII